MADITDVITLDAGSQSTLVGGASFSDALVIDNGNSVVLTGAASQDVVVSGGVSTNVYAQNYQLVKNGSQVRSFDYTVEITEPSLLNNNANNVTLDGAPAMLGGDLVNTTGSETDASQTNDLAVDNGTRILLTGGMYQRQDLSISTGVNVIVRGSVVFDGDSVTDSGSSTEIIDGHIIGVASGAQSNIYGWKEEPNTIVVVNGGSVEVGVGQIIVNAPDMIVSNGGQVHFGGQKPEDIHVDARPVVAVFRGEQVENSDIIVTSGVTVTLTGTSFGGTVSDVGVPCVTFVGSMATGREFVKGQITEIPEISLDSSIKLGVKLYSCDNKLLNPTSFTSAYFTFDDTLLIGANIDPVQSLIYSVIRPDDFVGIVRNKTYDVRLHTVDKSDNPSIVLTRKLRFI